MCPAVLQFLCNVIPCKFTSKNGFHCYLCSLYARACLLPDDSMAWESPEKADNVGRLFIQILLT